MGFTNRINEILETLSINQSALASKLGVSRGIVSEFASGAREPSKEFLFGLSKIGISLDWFLSGKGDMFRGQEQEKPAKEEKHPIDSHIEALINENMKEIETRLSTLESKYEKFSHLPENKAFPEPEYPAETGDEAGYTRDPEPEYERILCFEDIAAGPPIWQFTDSGRVVDVPLRFIKGRPEDYCALRVRGNSMIDAFIPDGSLVLIRKSDAPQNGKIQVVRIDERVTLKRMREDEDHSWTLCCEDGTGRTIPLGDENLVQGDFVAVLPPAAQPYTVEE